MNLAQHIPVVEAKKALSKEHRKAIFDHRNQLSVLGKFNGTDQQLKYVREQVFDLGLKLTVDGYAVPKVGAVFDGLPVTTTEHARDLADKVGFAIMPMRYLADAFRPDYQDARRIEVLDEKLDIWVMAPVTAYSLAKHLKSKDKPIHVPQDVAQAFMALSMSVPVFRAMQKQLDDLQNHIRDYHDRLGSLEQEVRALVTRVDALAEQAARERAHRNAEAAEAKKREAEILAWYRSGSDPLVLALPPGKTIRDNTVAFIGPCWGELPASVAKALALKPLKKGK
jgi:hypothetical protein